MDKNYGLNAGRILIADPFLMDLTFQRSVILLTEHNEDGSMGFILNQPSNLMIHEIFKDFPTFNARVYLGGPVDQDIIFYLHSLGDKVPESIQITKNIWLGGKMENIKELVKNGELKEEDIRFFIGYSGWTSNQLKEEIKKSSWIVGGTKTSYVFGKKHDAIWKNALQSNNQKLAFYGDYAFTPSFN